MISGNVAGRQRPAGAVRGTPQHPYRVLVVDDHPVIAQGIAQMLGPVPDLDVIGAVTDVATALARLDDGGDVDVIVLDLQLDGESGLALLTALGDPVAAVPVLVFSMHPPGPLAVAALEAGARGYLTKGAPVETLAVALRRVAGGGSWTDPELKAVLAERTMTATALSPREVEVLLLLAEGQRTSEIAAQLHLSPKTISAHKRRIQRKLGARNVADLLRCAELLQPDGEVGVNCRCRGQRVGGPRQVGGGLDTVEHDHRDQRLGGMEPAGSAADPADTGAVGLGDLVGQLPLDGRPDRRAGVADGPGKRDERCEPRA